MEIDAALGPAEIALLPRRDWSGACAVVFDVLRATSSMLTALAAGASRIIPVETIEEALAAKMRHPDALLCGERGGDRIEGFDLGNSPSEYGAVSGRTLVWTTTNGTVALRRSAAARRVFVGALVNLSSLVAALRRTECRRLVLVCAGTHETVALEDVLAAGAVCEAFPGANLTDAARIARSTWLELGPALPDSLRLARNGRALYSAHRQQDVSDCAAIDSLEVVGEMDSGGIITAMHLPAEVAG